MSGNLLFGLFAIAMALLTALAWRALQGKGKGSRSENRRRRAQSACLTSGYCHRPYQRALA
jgi:hypothetical protein